MDLTFKTEDGVFNHRVGAIMIKDNQILMVENRKQNYYYSIGGRVKFGESLDRALEREIYEELGISVDESMMRVGYIYEDFFVERESKEKYHELAVYYYVDIKDMIIDIEMIDNDLSKNEKLVWLDMDSLDDKEVFPKFFRRELKLKNKGIKYITSRD